VNWTLDTDPLFVYRDMIPNYFKKYGITKYSATHILCECEALAYLRFRHLGRYFMEPSDYLDIPTYKILHYIRGAGLLKG
jgi:hypothetical protein